MTRYTARSPVGYAIRTEHARVASALAAWGYRVTEGDG